MTLKEFVQILIPHGDNLHINAPLAGISFASDNWEFVQEGLMTLADTNDANPIIVRKFTSIESEEPFPNNPDKKLPLKLTAIFLADGGEVFPISASEAKNSFSVDSQTGEPIDPGKSNLFLDGEEFLTRL